jgi:RHS repeat-associated protein
MNAAPLPLRFNFLVSMKQLRLLCGLVLSALFAAVADASPMTPPTSSDGSTTYGSSFSPSISTSPDNGTGDLLWCVGGYTNWGTGAWTPPGAGTYTFWVAQKADGSHEGNNNDPLQGPIEVNGTGYTLTVNKAPMSDPTSASGATTTGTAWLPSINLPGGNGSGEAIWCVWGNTNWGTGSWTPTVPGTYTFSVGQRGDGNHAGNNNDQLAGNIQVAAQTYTLTVTQQTYALSVLYGSGSGSYASGTTVAITAGTYTGYTFSYWGLASGSGNIADWSSTSTSFAMGNSAAEVVAVFDTSPPANLRVTDHQPTQFTVAWDTAPNFGYFVLCDGTTTYTESGSFTKTGASPGMNYPVAVQAVDSDGFLSDWSVVTATTLSDTQAPSQPGNLHATGIDTASASIAWNASSDNVGVVGYVVMVDGNSAGAFTTTDTSATCSGLSPNASHTIEVLAMDGSGNMSSWSSVSFTTPPDTQAPAAPMRLRVGSVSVTCLRLSWDAAADNVGATQYQVFQNGALIGTTSDTFLEVSGLTAVTSYTFTVKAADAAGNWSGLSNPLSVGTNAPILIGLHASGENVPSGSSLTLTSWEGSQSLAASATSNGTWTTVHQYRQVAPGIDNKLRITGPSYRREVRFEVPSGFTLFVNGDPYTTTATLSLATANGANTPSADVSFMLMPNDGTAALRAGYSIDPQISADDVIWAVGLGRTPDGRTLGSLALRKTNVTGAAFSIDALSLTGPATNGSLAIYGDSQYGGPWGCDRRFIFTTDNGWLWLDDHVSGQPQNYAEIKAYPADTNPQWTGTTYRFLRGGTEVQPFMKYAISSNAPTNDTITITKNVGAAEQLSWALNKSVSSGTITWLLRKAGQQTLRTVSTVSGNLTTDEVTLEDGAGNVAQRFRKTYQLMDWGKKEVVSEIDDPNGANLATTYTYGTSGPSYGKLLSVTKPDGTYVTYEYATDDAAYGNLAKTYTNWLDVASTAATASPTNAKVASITYTPLYAYQADIVNTSMTTVPQNGSPVTIAKSVVTADFTSTTFAGKRARKDTVQTWFGPGASDYLTTSRTTYHPAETTGGLANRLISQTASDGTKISTIYYQGYFTDAGESTATVFRTSNASWLNTQYGEYKFNGFSTQVAGSQLVNTWDGQAIDPIYLVPNRSTIQLTVIDDGQPAHVVNYVFTGSAGGTPNFELIGRQTHTESTTNGTTKKTNTTHRGEQTQQVFTNGRLMSEIGNDGSTVNYTYDASGMLVRKESTGVAATGSYAAQSSVYTHYTYDGASRKLTEKVSASSNASDPGPTTTYHYDSAGRLDSTTDPTGLTTTIAYDLVNHRTTTTLPGGATKIVTNYADGSLKSISGTAVVGEYHAVTVNSDGTMTRTAYALRSADLANPTAAPRWAKSTVDWLGRSLREESPASGGTVAKLSTFNAKGQLTKVQTVDGASGAKLVADSVTEYNAYEVAYRSGSDLDGNPGLQPGSSLDRVTDTDSVYEKDGSGVWWLKKTTLVYNQTANATPVTLSIGKTRLNGFAALGTNVQADAIAIDVNGNQTRSQTTLDRANRVVVSNNDVPGSTTNQVTTTRNGLLVSNQAVTGAVTTYAYDGLRRLICASDPRIDGTTLAKDIAPRTGYYDGTAAVGSRYQKAWIKGPSGDQVSYTYLSTTGQLASVQQPPLPNQPGKFTYYAYNRRGDVIRTWGQVPYPVEYAFNDYGEKVAMRTFRDTALDFTASTWPLGDEADPAAPDPSTWVSGDKTTWTLDPATGLLLSKIDAAGKHVDYTYTRLGLVSRNTWSRGVYTDYRYFGDDAGDPQTGELKWVNYSDTPNTAQDVAYTYNRMGDTATVTDATGTRSFAYNPANTKLQTETLPAFLGNHVYTPKYDPSGVGTKGRTIGFSLGTLGSQTSDYDVTYGYDAYGRPNTFTAGGVAFTYGYAGTSNLIASVADPASGWTQTRTWLANRNLLDKIDTKVSTASKAAFDYDYDAWARRTSVIRSGEMFSRYVGQGQIGTWGYNDRSEVISAQNYHGQTLTDLSYPIEGRSYSFGFDNIGNRTQSGVDGRTTTYEHNNLNELLGRTTPSQADVAGLAPTGSTVQVNGQAVTRQGDYYHGVVDVANGSNAVIATMNVTSTAPSNTISRKVFVPKAALGAGDKWQYDDDGNLTRDDQWSYWWDAENRLIAMQTRTDLLSSGVIAAGDARRLEFTYDYRGRRVEKLVRYGWNGSTFTSVLSDTRFIYSGWNLIAEYDLVPGTSNLVLKRSYTWGLDWSGTVDGAGGVGGLLMAQEGSAQYLYAMDGNGNVSAVVNRSGGATVAEYEYSPFGELLRASNTYAQTNPFRFSTKYTDNETGLVYYGKRYYSPSTGRFLGRDPSGEQGGLNLFAFVNNNPVNVWDLLGMEPDTVCREPDQESPAPEIVLGGVKGAVVENHDADNPYGGSTAAEGGDEFFSGMAENQAFLAGIEQQQAEFVNQGVAQDELKKAQDQAFLASFNATVGANVAATLSAGTDQAMSKQLDNTLAAMTATATQSAQANLDNLAASYASAANANFTRATDSNAQLNLSGAMASLGSWNTANMSSTVAVDSGTANDDDNVTEAMIRSWSPMMAPVAVTAPRSGTDADCADNGNNTLVGAANLFVATVGGQGLTNTVNNLVPAANAALGGYAGFQKVFTFGASSTAGFDPAAVQTGQTVAKFTVATAATVGTTGAANALLRSFTAVGTPAFFSGMSPAAAQAAVAPAGGYILGATRAGVFIENTFLPWVQTNLPTVAGPVTNVTWKVASYVYAAASSTTSSTAFYVGTGTGYIWQTIERPVLLNAGTTIITIGSGGAGP